MLQLLNGLLEVSLTMLGLQLLPHSEGHRTLVQSLIGADCHLDLITDPQ